MEILQQGDLIRFIEQDQENRDIILKKKNEKDFILNSNIRGIYRSNKIELDDLFFLEEVLLEKHYF